MICENGHETVYYGGPPECPVCARDKEVWEYKQENTKLRMEITDLKIRIAQADANFREIVRIAEKLLVKYGEG